MNDYRELLIGCGRRRDKRVWLPPELSQGAGPASNRLWRNLFTLDHPDVNVGQDIFCDLNLDGQFSWTFCPTDIARDEREAKLREFIDEDAIMLPDLWDEIHAYEVLEHLGKLGDERSFFAQFSELWRILKPGGHLLATVPSRFSEWLWGDPSHKRAIYPCTLAFLSQPNYVIQCDTPETRTPMSDFRHLYKADFRTVYSHDNKLHHTFILQAVKPSRIAV